MTVQILIYFSDFFDISHDLLDEYGAFDISLINDLPLFIDPFLLFNSDNLTYQKLHDDVIAYLKFLRDKSSNPGIKQGLIDSWYRFSEVRQTWLGYSGVGNYGRGLGPDFAEALHRNLNTIFSNFGEEEITQSSHLEKLCLIKGGVGRDNISDFTTNLIKSFLLEYTQAFAIQHIDPQLRRRFTVDKVKFNYATESWERGVFDLPCHLDQYVVLTPKDILTRDETWINNGDFRSIKTFNEIVVALPNEQLRAQIDNYIQRRLAQSVTPRQGRRKKATNKDLQAAIEGAIDEYPELIDYYVRHKEEHKEEATAISEQKVEMAETVFIDKVRELTRILSDTTQFYTFSNTYEEAHARITFFKDVIENKGGHKVFFVDDQPIRRESDLHILFRLVWFPTISDVTREANDGRGPVDFKISRGSKDKTLVEFKLASSHQLKRNLEKQAEIYQKASDADHAIKVIFYFTSEDHQKVQAALRSLHMLDNKDIILVDARPDNKPSGSKA